MMVAILAAAVIAAAPAANIVPVLLTASAAEVTLPDNLKLVTEKGNLTVKIPDGVSDSYEVKAYEMLQLVIAKDSTWTSGTQMTNDDNNIYVVTNNFKGFFEAAKTDYTGDGSTLPTADTLYLTYNATNNCLKITTTSQGEKNKDYIEIDNTAYSTGHKGKLDTTYFEADIVSRITSSPSNANETTASAARLLSDWASRYIKAKGLSADATATKSDKKFEFKDTTALVYGYYVIVTSDDTTDNDKSVINQSILNVPQADNVTLKATPITVDKSVDNLIDANNKNNGETEDNKLKNSTTTRYDVGNDGGYDKITANIGDILQYKVKSHIPSLTSYVLSDKNKLVDIDVELTESNFNATIAEKFIYTFRDTMKNQDFIPVDVRVQIKNVTKVVNGLKMEILDSDNTTVKATYYVKEANGKYYLVTENDEVNKENAIGRLWETNYNATDKKNFFAINFDLGKLKSLGLDGKDVVFTYNAELKGEAGNADATNKAQFTYSNDPYDSKSTDTIDDENKVYTYDLKVDKLFSDGAKTEDLYGMVKFKLYSQDSSHTDRKAIDFVQKPDGSYVRADSDDTNTTDQLAVDTTDGTLHLHGLGEGTYYLEEQNEDNVLSNAGYNKVNPITITISAKKGNGITDSETFELFDNTNGTGVTAELDEVPFTPGKIGGNDEYGIEFNVVNQKGFKLPFTGEFGNWALAISGILLVAVGGTVIVLVNRKKKDSPIDNEK